MGLRRRISSGSARAIFLEKDRLIRVIEGASAELKAAFPYVKAVFLFGSLVRGDFRGTSDADILVVVSHKLTKDNFLKIRNEIYDFLAERIPIGFDLLVWDEEMFMNLKDKYSPMLKLA